MIKLFYTVLMTALLLLFLSSCEQDEKIVEVTVNDTLIAVVVTPVNTGPDNVSIGSTVTLTATTTTLSGVGDLTLHWSAAAGAGTFSSSTGDTVTWKAPETENTYTIVVVAEDGEFSGVGTLNIGVGMYAATADTFYVGGTACAGCHSSTDHDWDGTAHAHAWETLQASDHAASYCNRCHTVDFAQVAGNSGYDDVPVEMFENVQCESCHGPGSAHIAGPSSENISKSFDHEATCGTCHDGTHHPFLSDWKESAHYNSPLNHGAESGSCQGCHEGVAGAVRLSGDLSNFYGSGSTPDRPENEPVGRIGCITCHDPHNADNPGQLRTVADVVLVTANGESPVITDGGVGKLCMQCHHARRGPDAQIAAGYGHFGPHGSPQADLAAGKTAFEGVADPGFQWADPSHLKVQNSCKTCHLNTSEYVSENEPAYTGHTFEPRVEACANCHGPINDFEDIMALDDFDGDGNVEGVQDEVRGLLSRLEEALIDSFAANGITTTGWDEDSLAHEIGIVEHVRTPGDTLVVPTLWRQAGWNWVFVLDDGSFGMHNPDYAVQILQQSYKHLTGEEVVGAKAEGNNSVANIQIVQ